MAEEMEYGTDEPFDGEVLNAMKNVGVTGSACSCIRENLFMIADLAIARWADKPVDSDIVLKSLFAVNVGTYRILLRILESFYATHPEHWTVVQLNRVILTPTQKPRLGYTLDRVLMCMLGYYSALLDRGHHARMFGFQDVLAVRKAGSKVLLRALKIARPIKVIIICIFIITTTSLSHQLICLL